jgi:hypothetical protein
MTVAIDFPAVRPAAFLAADAEYVPLGRFVRPDDLADLLRGVRGAKVVTVEARTEPRLLARHPLTGAPNPYKGNVVKVSRVNGMINWRYAASVNRQRVREGLAPDFAALPRHWGVRVPGTPLVEHDGRTYLELKVERSLEHRYETVAGEPLDAAAVEAFLPRSSPGRQGVARPVVLRDYDLANLVSLRLEGVVYLLRAGGATAVLPELASRLSA